MYNLLRPWYGSYCLMLCCTSCNGESYRHPVRWSSRLNDLNDVFRWLMRDYYMGKSDMPVIVDYTGLRDNHLPIIYNNVPVEGDLSTLNF